MFKKRKEKEKRETPHPLSSWLREGGRAWGGKNADGKRVFCVKSKK